MLKVVEGDRIDSVSWDGLVASSPVASWFQTHEAFCFFDRASFMEAFAIGVENDGVLKGVVVGYVQKDGGKVKQFFSRRAIVNGGALLAVDITDEELRVLLKALKTKLKRKAIYIEMRNFEDYSQWCLVFEECGFKYEPHLNFHLNCEDWGMVESKIGKHRRRYIRLSVKNGAKLVESPSIEQVRSYYSVLYELYRTKIKRPLFPLSYFEALYECGSCRFILIEYEGSIIGGSVCVVLANRTVYEWFACGKDGAYKNIYPSSLTKYEGIRFAHDNGCKVFDMMGAGKPNEEYGVRDFKAEFGGDLVENGRLLMVNHLSLYLIGKIGVNLWKFVK